jgi:replicative DNA helicase
MQLRGTDILAQEADMILSVYRDRDLNSMRSDNGRILINKMRDGETDFEIPVRFMPETLQFEEVAYAQ